VGSLSTAVGGSGGGVAVRWGAWQQAAAAQSPAPAHPAHAPHWSYDRAEAQHDVYRYPGSLTTPPCSEGVEWFVLKEHATASAAQIEAFRTIMRHDNRPVQPLAGRAVHNDVIR
jgi:hypothetical protein